MITAKGYIVFTLTIILPLFLFIITSMFISDNYWAKLCYTWLGLVVIIGSYQFFGTMFKQIAKKKIGRSYKFINKKGLVGKTPAKTSILNELNKQVKPSLYDDIEKGKEPDLGDIGTSSVILTSEDILGAINSPQPKEDPVEMLKQDPSGKILIIKGVNDNDENDVELILTNRGHQFWMNDYSFEEIMNGTFLSDLWLEYSKSDMRHFDFEHWIYHHHMVQGLGSMGCGSLLLIIFPISAVASESAWILLLFTIFQMISTCIYFFTLLWKGCFSSGKYFLYWIPVFFVIISDIIIFEYAIYLLHYK